LWGSFFSRVEQVDGQSVAMVRPFRRGVFSRVGLNVGKPLAPGEVQPALLHARVRVLMAD
ncbi:MAG: phospholipid/glycerol acyltransferase, partial [Polaromonas sp.]|nr:phospholipid/glycerol acyltransferase [Polaromonas sp.]